MEYVPKINIFGLKMMVKRGLEKIIKKFSMPNIIFLTSLAKIANSVTKITFFVHGGILKKCGVCTYDKVHIF